MNNVFTMVPPVAPPGMPNIAYFPAYFLGLILQRGRGPTKIGREIGNVSHHFLGPHEMMRNIAYFPAYFRGATPALKYEPKKVGREIGNVWHHFLGPHVMMRNIAYFPAYFLGADARVEL